MNEETLAHWGLSRQKRNKITVITVKVQQSLDMPWSFQDFEAPKFQDIRRMKVVRFLALPPTAFTPKEIFLVLI